jgi:uncharacterized damage-inducible protein DinB
MSFAAHARLLIEYNEYANGRVLERAMTLDDSALEESGSASYGSIAATLGHIVGAQVVWLSRWIGAPPAAIEPASREGLIAAFDRSHDSLRRFAAALGDDDWDRVIAYNDKAGQPHEVPLGVLITHAVNHGTMHRGEAGMLLAAHDRSPGDLDFVLWVIERQRS